MKQRCVNAASIKIDVTGTFCRRANRITPPYFIVAFSVQSSRVKLFDEDAVLGSSRPATPSKVRFKGKENKKSLDDSVASVVADEDPAPLTPTRRSSTKKTPASSPRLTRSPKSPRPSSTIKSTNELKMALQTATRLQTELTASHKLVEGLYEKVSQRIEALTRLRLECYVARNIRIGSTKIKTSPKTL